MMVSSRYLLRNGYVPGKAIQLVDTLTIRLRQGKYLGTLEDVNHLDLVGWVNTARYKWAELMGKEIKFKPASFYLEVTAKLAEEVEGLSLDDASSSDEEPEVLFSAGGNDDEESLRSKSKQKQRADVVGTSLPAPSGTVGGGVD
jgi:triacylglycerol lipase